MVDTGPRIDDIAAMHVATDTWRGWREPRPCGPYVETPYHHALVEVRRAGEDGSRAVDPADVPLNDRLEEISWRPMCWASEGVIERRYFDVVDKNCALPGARNFWYHRLQSVFEQTFEGIGVSDLGAMNWIEAIRRRHEFCASNGSLYRLLVVPETHAVYPDLLPGSPEPSPDRPMARILRFAPPDVQDMIVYPYDALRNGRVVRDTCFPDDVHFSSYGAFLVYRELMKSLPCRDPAHVVREADLACREGPMMGGLGRALGLEGYVAEHVKPPPVARKSLVKDMRFAVGKVDCYEMENQSLPSLAMFRSSNTTGLFPYLFHSFSRIAAVAGKKMIYDFIESERATVVVTEIPERYLSGHAVWSTHNPDNGPDDANDLSFLAATGFPLPLPRAAYEAEAAA